ncbi:MAG: sigma 54-interacting transcriptional regulator, partial [Bryobacterales bacterium]|nr:sigma 54-interacting transcriptional regulator [Bryobacterales bacterium]
RRAEASLAEPEEKESRIDDIPETEMIGSSALMVDIFKVLAKVAPTDATLLVEGETGTGKELIARMIHRYSRRAEKPFVAVDCGSIPPSLLESE